jgi:hypothetical protein
MLLIGWVVTIVIGAFDARLPAVGVSMIKMPKIFSQMLSILICPFLVSGQIAYFTLVAINPSLKIFAPIVWFRKVELVYWFTYFTFLTYFGIHSSLPFVKMLTLPFKEKLFEGHIPLGWHHNGKILPSSFLSVLAVSPLIFNVVHVNKYGSYTEKHEKTLGLTFYRSVL